MKNNKLRSRQNSNDNNSNLYQNDYREYNERRQRVVHLKYLIVCWI